MMVAQPPPIIRMLAHDVRWNLVSALANSDYRVHELVELVKKPINLVSYHLRQLREANLVSEQRSQADARDVYYTLDIAELQAAYLGAAQILHPALQPTTTETPPVVAQSPARILFLCTHNSARSQMAAGLMRHFGGEHVAVWSAGTEPQAVHPLALDVMNQHQLPTDELQSNHLATFIGQDFDYIVTVCDRARETCPVFPGDPTRIHWSFPDPAAVVGATAQRQAFEQTFRQLQIRIQFLLTTIERQRRIA